MSNIRHKLAGNADDIRSRQVNNVAARKLRDTLTGFVKLRPVAFDEQWHQTESTVIMGRH